MAQCKKNGCVNEAITHPRWGRKRYCREHGHAYSDKRDAALAARAEMPDCDSGISPSCEGKVGSLRAARGETTCRWCIGAAQELHDLHEREVNEAKRRMRERVALAECETVADLRDWFERNLI